VLIALLVSVVVAGPLLTPYAPNAQLDIIALRSQAPSLAHPFGTDAVSRDVLSRVLDGGRVSLALAILSVLLSLVVGTLYGAMSTLAGGGVDTTMRRLLDVALSIPRLLVLLAQFEDALQPELEAHGRLRTEASMASAIWASALYVSP
jgi:peptide/nickel transport system permease protein